MKSRDPRAYHEAACLHCGKAFVYRDSLQRHLPGCAQRLRGVILQLITQFEHDELDLSCTDQTRSIVRSAKKLLEEPTR